MVLREKRKVKRLYLKRKVNRARGIIPGPEMGSRSKKLFGFARIGGFLRARALGREEEAQGQPANQHKREEDRDHNHHNPDQHLNHPLIDFDNGVTGGGEGFAAVVAAVTDDTNTARIVAVIIGKKRRLNCTETFTM